MEVIISQREDDIYLKRKFDPKKKSRQHQSKKSISILHDAP